MKILLTVFSLFCAVLLTLRTMLKIENIDLDIGFYIESNVYTTIYGALLLAGLLLLLIMGFRGVYSDFLISRAKSRAACVLLAGAGIALSVQNAAVIYNAVDEAQEFLTASNGIAIAGALCGLCLIGIAFRYFYRNKKAWFIVALLPAFYTLATLIDRFFHYNAINSISDNQLEVLFYASCSLMLLEQMRVLCGIGVEKGLKTLSALGLITSLSGLTLCVPQLIARCFGTVSAVDLPVIESAFVLLISLYSMCIALYALSRRKIPE